MYEEKAVAKSHVTDEVLLATIRDLYETCQMAFQDHGSNPGFARLEPQ